MDHARLEHKYQQIVKKLRLLIDKKNVEREEMILLAEENLNLKAQLTEQNEHLKSFQNHEKISKIVDNVSGDEEKTTELKLKINEYIKEIDKCIAHLSE